MEKRMDSNKENNKDDKKTWRIIKRQEKEDYEELNIRLSPEKTSPTMNLEYEKHNVIYQDPTLVPNVVFVSPQTLSQSAHDIWSMKDIDIIIWSSSI